MDAAYADLKERLGEIHDLQKTRALLAWDQQVLMPPGGSGVRAEQIATLDRIAHTTFSSDEIGRLLDRLESFEADRPYDSDEASLVRVTRLDWEKARRVPAELRAEMSRASSLALPVWAAARQTSNFALFLPLLRENLELRRRYIDCFDTYDEPYDVLLDDYERGTTTAEVRAVFERLKVDQVPLVAGATREGERPGRDRPFPLEAQRQFELQVLERFGFERASWRLDPTVHPFASSLGTDDIRLTTRYHEQNLDGLFASMHECGHGLYEHGVSRSLERTPLARGTSLGLHESQSRLWENLVGRSLSFWRFFFPRLRDTFPEALGDVELEDWYASVNWVQPSPIRVEADEATYNLHVILRFELEQELLAGSVEPAELSEIWNARMLDYLGIEPANDRLGVLQDMHWAGGHIGYFSTYALGNVISAQIWERIASELPDLDAQFEQGEFGELRDWLTERLYRHGRKFTPKEMLERIVGGPIDPDPYLRYLGTKLATLT
ncbi:MAG: carboxypeptidase M32 [Gaiellaceae bacterium MAG52_C11]|nr:carboxypeptidase M32 [Candidatus Gaiellasilicea maunaloa]